MRVFDFGQEATGVIAIGQIATGVIAIGQLATGVIAIGQISRGVIALGQFSVGVVGAGQLGVGLVYGAGMLGFGTFAGGLVPIPLLGHLRFTDLVHGRFRADRIQPTPWRILLLAALIAVVALAALIPLWQGLFGAAGVLDIPPDRR